MAHSTSIVNPQVTAVTGSVTALREIAPGTSGTLSPRPGMPTLPVPMKILRFDEPHLMSYFSLPFRLSGMSAD